MEAVVSGAGGRGEAPDLSVVVASHDRPLRLRWLLNALEEQTLERERWEVVIATTDPDLVDLVAGHPVGARHVRPAATSPAAQRNAGWRAARAPLVAFTDDDCRPEAAWLERLLAAAQANPAAVVQGAVRPDPDEEHLLAAAPHARSLRVDPPSAFAEAANVLYPRAVLERLGGFDERFPAAAGEDTDLMLRAREAGAAYVGAPDALTFHAVDPAGLLRRARSLPRWRHVAKVVRRHPQARELLALGVLFRPSHGALPGALAAIPLARRRPLLAALLALPWALLAAPRYGTGPRGLARSASELPGRLALDCVETAAMVAGALQERTLVL